MAYSDLREWIKALEKAGEVRHIRHEVDPILEMAEIADRVSKMGQPGRTRPGERRKENTSRQQNYAPGGPALVFENVKGYPGQKVLMNQFGSERRMCLALGVDSLDEVAARIQELINLRSPEGFLDKIRMLPMLADVGKFFPKLIAAKDAPCKQVILRDNFSVLDFPILQCWPGDGGRFITLPCVVTRDPRDKSGKRNVGMYRMQVYDGQTTGMHWQRQKVAAEHYRERIRQSAVANSDDPAAARVAIMAETGGGMNLSS
ncbi:MAG: UbiD family decarboxylase domain-containing protein [Acidobacteriaceae bacterium]